MQTKLTLRLEERLIEAAKQHAEKRGKSLSRLVADFFSSLEGKLPNEQSMAPTTMRLKGCLKGSGGQEDYRAHLEGKFK